MGLIGWKVKGLWAAIALALLPLVGCEREWHFSIIGFDSASTPKFCVSTKPACSGKGVGLGGFAVVEVPATGSNERPRTVWGITPITNELLHQFVYGVTPVGWKQDIPPEPLRVGRTYEVGLYQFRLKEEGGKLNYEVAPIGQLK